jgi:hypothetical protein
MGYRCRLCPPRQLPLINILSVIYTFEMLSPPFHGVHLAFQRFPHRHQPRDRISLVESTVRYTSAFMMLAGRLNLERLSLCVSAIEGFTLSSSFMEAFWSETKQVIKVSQNTPKWIEFFYLISCFTQFLFLFKSEIGINNTRSYPLKSLCTFHKSFQELVCHQRCPWS